MNRSLKLKNNTNTAHLTHVIHPSGPLAEKTLLNRKTPATLSRKSRFCQQPMFLLAMAWVMLSIASPASGQFIQLQLIIDQELAIRPYGRLDLTGYEANRGWVQVAPFDHNAGRFFLTSGEYCALNISIRSPEFLSRDRFNQLPFILKTAFENKGNGAERTLTPFNEHAACFPVRENNQPSRNRATSPGAKGVMLYFYGSIYIGDVPPGVYLGTVTVRIEYP